MTGHEHDWLAERAQSGHPATEAYALHEAYPGERDDLRRELTLALRDCPCRDGDRFAALVANAMELNTLPVLRAVVSLWRGAYRALLDNRPSPVAHTECTALTADERSRLVALRSRLQR